MKSWRSRLARMNDMFDTYIKENFKVVDYQIKTPSMREHGLTWRPYRYYKRRKAMAARRRCIALKSIQIIEAKSAVDKERRLKMESDTDSFDILIDNCCSHTSQVISQSKRIQWKYQFNNGGYSQEENQG